MTKADLSLLISVGVLFLLIVGVSFFVIRPLAGRVGTLQAERSKNASELADLEQRSQTLTTLAKDRSKIETLGQRALTYLPTTIMAGPLVMDLAAIARESGTSVPSISFQDATVQKGAGAGLPQYPLTMSVEGNFNQLRDFLRDLEQNLRFSDVSALVLTKQDPALALQITGTIFSKPETASSKDQSLTIDTKIEDLLLNRRIFGGTISTSGPSRPDPFEGL